jgi:hypothetical protein
LNISKINPDNREGSDDNAYVDSFPQSIKSIIASLRVVVDQIHSDFKQARELILEIARQLDERELCERNQISRTIKKILKDKIQEGKVTEKWIEECLPSEYKRQYTKSEPSSLSKQQPKEQIIEVSTEGNQTLPGQQDDDKGIERLNERQLSNKMESGNKPKQSVIPAAGRELKAVENDNEDNAVCAVTVDSVLKIDKEYAHLMSALYDFDPETLKLSIQRHGQYVPIIVNQDGIILDGHLRYGACQELGIKPEIMVRQFENRLEEKKFIIEVNLCRRHLNEFQRSELQRNLDSIQSKLAEVRD